MACHAPLQTTETILSPPHLGHTEQQSSVTAQRWAWSKGLSFDYSASTTAATQKSRVAPFPKAWLLPSPVPPCITSFQVVLSFCWQAPCHLPEVAPGRTGPLFLKQPLKPPKSYESMPCSHMIFGESKGQDPLAQLPEDQQTMRDTLFHAASTTSKNESGVCFPRIVGGCWLTLVCHPKCGDVSPLTYVRGSSSLI